jgi:hypothetical protein
LAWAAIRDVIRQGHSAMKFSGLDADIHFTLHTAAPSHLNRKSVVRHWSH